VAARIPTAAMRKVFTIPTQRARPPVLGVMSIPSDTCMSGFVSINRKSVGTLDALRLLLASVFRKNKANTTSTKAMT